MHIITISNQKGGVGKTTTALAFSFIFAKYKRKVLFIDLDQQGNASYILRADENYSNIYDVLIDGKNIHNAIQKYYDNDNLFFISSSNNLSLADTKLKNIANSDIILKKRISNLKVKFDYIIIDTPPSLNMLTINSFVTSNYVIIPTNADVFSLQGIGQLYHTVKAVQEERNPDLKILGILVTRYDDRTNLSKHLYKLLLETAKHLDTKLFRYAIRESVKIRESQAFQENMNKYHTSTAMVDYSLVSKLIIIEIENLM